MGKFNKFDFRYSSVQYQLKTYIYHWKCVKKCVVNGLDSTCVSWVIRFSDLQCGYMFTFLFMKTNIYENYYKPHFNWNGI
jgi:hypothetical protein